MSVDVTVADVSVVTVVDCTRPSADTERTAVSPQPRPEARVPGAAFTLPANPLGDLDAAELASFIDLTLLETRRAAPAPESRLARARRFILGAGRPSPARMVRRAGPYAACVLGGLLLGGALRPGPSAAPVVPATPSFPGTLATPAAAPFPPVAVADEIPSPSVAVADEIPAPPPDPPSTVADQPLNRASAKAAKSPPHRALKKHNRRRVAAR
jgi:hypothetical protein